MLMMTLGMFIYVHLPLTETNNLGINRTNYARLWLSLIAPASPKTAAKRRKYAKLVGNIDDVCSLLLLVLFKTHDYSRIFIQFSNLPLPGVQPFRMLTMRPMGLKEVVV